LTPSTDPAHPNFEAKTLARTYPRTVAGTLTSMTFEPSSGNATFAFTPSTSVVVTKLPTEVFVSLHFYYPDGILWSAEPTGSMTGSLNSTSGVLSLLLADPVEAALGSLGDVVVSIWPA